MLIARISTPTPLHATPVTRQVGIRQRSLGRRCRLGRATELVFVLVTGVTLALSGALAGGAQAQVVWDGDTSTDWTIGTNWAGDTVPAPGEAAELNDGGLANQPALNTGDAATVDTLAVSAGTLTLGGDLTATNGTTVSGDGTVAISASGSLTTTTVGILSGGTVTNTDGSIVADVNNAGIFTNSGASAAVGGVTNSGTGSNAGGTIGLLTNTGGTFENAGVIIGGANVSGGVVTLISGSDLGDAAGVEVSLDGTLTVNSGDTVGALDQTGGTIDGTDTLTVAGAFTQSGGATGGTVTIAAGSFTQSGGATLAAGTTVTSTGTNTLSGGTIAGTLNGGGATTIDTGTTTVSGTIEGEVTVDGAGRLRIENTADITGTITTTGSDISYADGVNEASAIVLDSPDTRLEVLTGAFAEQSGGISDGGNDHGLEKIGDGQLTLSGANTYTGLTTVSTGTLVVAGGSGVADVQNDATFINEGNSGTVTNAGTGSNILGGTLAGLVNNTGGTFTNSAIVLGTTTVNDGTVTLEGDSDLADGSRVTLNAPGTLAVNVDETIGSLEGDGALELAATLTTGGDDTDTEFSGAASGTGGITKAGIGTFILSGTNSYTGLTTVSEGTLALSGGAAIADTGEVSVGSGATLRLDDNEAIGALSASASASDAAVDVGLSNELDITGGTDTTYAGTMAGTGTLINTGSATLTLTGDGSGFTGVLGATGAGAGIAFTGAGQTGALGVGAAAGATFSTEGGALLASNTVLSADGDITFSGSETIGTITNAAASGLGTGTIALSGADTTLTLTGEANGLNPTNISGMAGVISGDGGLTVTGGTHVLLGENTYAGATAVSGGRLDLTGSGATASTAISTQGTGILRSDGDALNPDAAVVNEGTLELTDGGAETVNSINGAGGIDLSLGSLLTLDAGISDISGVISGDGTLTISGTSVTTVSGDNTHTGGTTVDAGAELTNDGTLGGVGNAGSFTNNGTAGDVGNTGTFTNNDTAGDVTNEDGGLTENFGSVQDVLNTGEGTEFNNNEAASTLDVTNEAGAFFQNFDSATTGAVLNTGVSTRFDQFDTASTGDVRNEAGAEFNNFDSATTGAVLNTGSGSFFGNYDSATTGAVTNADGATFENEALIDGTLTVTGGTVTNFETGVVDGLTTITEDEDGSGVVINYGEVADVINSSFGNDGDYGFENYGRAGVVTNSGAGLNGAGGEIVTPPEETVTLFDLPPVPTIEALVNTGGFFDNQGLIDGAADVSGGVVFNFETGVVAGLTTITEDEDGSGVVVNYGTLQDVVNESTGTEDSYLNGFVNLVGGTAGAVTNRGYGTNTGTIAALTNSASGPFTDVPTFDSYGTITGDVVNDGEFYALGTIGGNIENTGKFEVGISDYYLDRPEALDYLDPEVNTQLLTSSGGTFVNSGAGALSVTGGDFTGLATLVNASSAEFGVTIGAGRTLQVGTFTNQGGALNNGTLAVGGSTLINQAGATFTNNGVVTGPVLNSGTLISNNGSSFSGGAFANLASGLFRPTGAVSVGGPAVNTGTVNMQNGSTGDRLTFGSTLAAGGSFALDANLANRTADLVTVAGATSGTPSFAFATTGTARLGQNILFFNANGGSYTVSPSQISGLATSGAVVSSVSQVGTGGDLYLVSQVNPAIGGVASNISLTQSLITTVINRPTDPLVDLGRVEGAACRSGGYARVSGGQATLTGESDNGLGNQDASIDSSFGSIQAGWDHGCYDGRYNGWDLAFGGLVGLTSGSSSQDVFQTNPANPSLLSSALAGSIDTNFDQQSVGVYMAARKDRFLANVQLRYDNTDFDFDESTVAGQIPMGLNGASASSQALTLGARINYVYAMSSPGLNFIPNAGFSYTHTDGDTVNFTNGSGQSLVLNSYNSMVGFAGGTLAKTVAGDSGKEATTTFMALNYYEDFGDDPTSVFYDGSGGSQGITTSNVGGFGEVSLGLNYFADVEGKMGGVKRMNAAIRADLRSGNNVSDAYALTAQLRLSF